MKAVSKLGQGVIVMLSQPSVPRFQTRYSDKSADEQMHAIRNQLGLIAGHASLLLAESTPGSVSHQSAEIISRACFTVSEHLQNIAAEVLDKKAQVPD